MGQRRGQLQAVIHLSHEEASRLLIEYHVGRLSPELSADVEEHVRTCPVCQREGLHHAPTEMRETVRQFEHIRPKRSFPNLPLRPILAFALLLVILVAVGISAVHHDLFYLSNMFNARGDFPSSNSLPVSTVPSQPTPSLLTATVRFETVHTHASAIAISPDGRLAAAAGMRSDTPVVVIYDTVSGNAQATLAWPGQSAPGTLAWSSSSDALAACDGTLLAIWQMPSRTLQIAIPMSKQSDLHVYEVTSGSVVQTLDARTALAAGTLLRWGADGQLSGAPAGAAAPSGVGGPSNPLIGLWRVGGSHLFMTSGGRLTIGYDGEEYAHGLLDWSPDERYVFWGRASQPVSATAASTASSAASVDNGVPTPDLVVGMAASRLAQAGHGDLLVWFSPDGNALAMCDRRAKGAALSIYSVDHDQVVSVIPQVCDDLNISSFSWMPSGRAFLLVSPNHPITLYPITLAAG